MPGSPSTTMHAVSPRHSPPRATSSCRSSGSRPTIGSVRAGTRRRQHSPGSSSGGLPDVRTARGREPAPMPERDPVMAFRLAEDAAFARHGVTVAEHSLDLGGRTVRVLESGDGPPIVLVPGDGAVAGAWAPLMAELPGHR